MALETKTIIEPVNDVHNVVGEEYSVVLHNDEINSFDYVARTLVEVCKHDTIQAEQCTYITHFKGRCDVKTGELNYLRPFRHSLIEKGLQATIEKSK